MGGSKHLIFLLLYTFIFFPLMSLPTYPFTLKHIFFYLINILLNKPFQMNLIPKLLTFYIIHILQLLLYFIVFFLYFAVIKNSNHFSVFFTNYFITLLDNLDWKINCLWMYAYDNIFNFFLQFFKNFRIYSCFFIAFVIIFLFSIL